MSAILEILTIYRQYWLITINIIGSTMYWMTQNSIWYWQYVLVLVNIWNLVLCESDLSSDLWLLLSITVWSHIKVYCFLLLNPRGVWIEFGFAKHLFLNGFVGYCWSEMIKWLSLLQFTNSQIRFKISESISVVHLVYSILTILDIVSVLSHISKNINVISVIFVPML